MGLQEVVSASNLADNKLRGCGEMGTCAGANAIIFASFCFF